MSWPILVVMIAGGVGLLWAGAEGLIHGARHTMLRMGLTPLVGGLIVVAFATSMPEVAGTLAAHLWTGSGSMAMGNVIGSNIANIGLIAGIAALIRPLHVTPQIFRREVPIMLGVSALFMVVAIKDNIGRGVGIFLVALICIYVWLQMYWGKKEHPKQLAAKAALEGKGWGKDALYLALGITALIAGAIILVDGAVGLAELAGLSDRVIGLTIIAIGTSLPELAASIIAARRDHTDIAIGNVVGSNIFNLLFVTGAAAIIYPIDFSDKLVVVDIPIMLLFSCLLWFFMWTTRRITRLEGALLIVCYLVYLGILIFGPF